MLVHQYFCWSEDFLNEHILIRWLPGPCVDEILIFFCHQLLNQCHNLLLPLYQLSLYQGRVDPNKLDKRGQKIAKYVREKKGKERMEREQAKLVEDLKKANAQIAEYEAQATNTRDDIARWQAMIDDWFERSQR